MSGLLNGQTVLVIGRGSAIARAVTLTARDAGAKVIAAGCDKFALSTAYLGEPAIGIEAVDQTDEDSISALGVRVGQVDHVVSTAATRVRGRLPQLERVAVRRSLDTEVIGPLMMARQIAPRMNEGGSFVLFSGVAAAKIAVGSLGVAIVDGAVDVLTRSLALELAPSGSTRSPRVWSTPTHEVSWMSTPRPTAPPTGASATRSGAPAPPPTSPTRSCSR